MIQSISGATRFGNLSAVPQFQGKKKAEPGVLVVRGQGSVERNPDTMKLNLSLNEQHEDKKAVYQALSSKAEALVRGLKALSFPLTWQPHLQVRDNQRYEQGKNIKDGYIGTLTVNIKDQGDDPAVFAKHAADIIAVAEANAASVAGPSYTISPDLYRRYEREADAKGYEDARASAEVVAQSGGFRLSTHPLEVKVGHVSAHGGGRGAMRMMAASAPESVEADGGGGHSAAAELFTYQPITITSKPIQAVFQIKRPKGE